MGLDAAEIVETPAEPVVETPAEAPVETPAAQPLLDTSQIESGRMPVEKPTEEPIVETEEAADEPTDEGKEADEPAKEAEEAKDEPAKEPEAITFDATDELAVLADKTTKVLEKYDLSDVPEVQALIDVWKAKAEAVPVAPDVAIISELADYGEPAAIKVALERDNLLNSVTEVSEGQYRPNTDKYAAEIYKEDPDKASWLYFDLAQLPSVKYQGLNRFQEGIADALGQDGDTLGTVMDRYEKAMAYARGTNAPSDAPAYIPQNLRDAYWSLSKESREELEAYAPDNDREDTNDADVRARKLDELSKIQKGIEADKRDKQQFEQSQVTKQQAFNNEVFTTQIKFFDGMRDTFTENIIKEVVFSTDPKMQNLLARQQVTTLTQAFYDDSDGEYARTALAESGINFDNAKAQQLVKAVEQASVALNVAKRAVDENGKQLNEVAFKKATRSFEDAGRLWQDFAADILKQEQELTATSKAEDVKAEVAKIKIAAKPRPAVKGVSTPATKKDALPAYGSKEWTDRYVNMAIEEQAAKTARYR